MEFLLYNLDNSSEILNVQIFVMMCQITITFFKKSKQQLTNKHSSKFNYKKPLKHKDTYQWRNNLIEMLIQ